MAFNSAGSALLGRTACKTINEHFVNKTSIHRVNTAAHSAPLLEKQDRGAVQTV